MTDRKVGLLVLGLVLTVLAAGCSAGPAVARFETTPATVYATTTPGGSSPEIGVSPAPADSAPASTAAPAASAAPAVPGKLPTVLIGLDGQFSMADLAVARGAAVNFENDDCCSPHTVNSDLPFSDKIDPGLTWSFTFNKAGKYLIWVDDDQSARLTVTVT